MPITRLENDRATHWLNFLKEFIFERRQLALVILLLLLLMPSTAYLQEAPLPLPTPKPETAAEEDPTKPILLSIRDEYRNFRGGGWANTVIFRIDRLVLKNFGIKDGSKGLLLRFDVPYNTVNRGNLTQKGLGDLYAQALYIPRFRKKYLVAIGTGLVLPTATDRFLGQGKFIIAPTLVPIWYFKRRERFAFVRVQNYISVAGRSSRPNINYLVADPTFVHRISERWWLAEDTEFKWDWQNTLASAITGLQIGRMMKGRLGFWFKPEVGWGSGRLSDFNLKFTVFRLR
jgi:hypothetical protein